MWIFAEQGAEQIFLLFNLELAMMKEGFGEREVLPLVGQRFLGEDSCRSSARS